MMTITQVQHLLAYLGDYTLAVDGIAGAGTEAAVRAFQERAGLEVDGIAGKQTQAALRAAVAAEQPEDGWAGIRYFVREEFRCKCGGRYCGGFPAEPSMALLAAADRVRDHFGAPVHVTSGLRCPVHNERVGGVAGSRHLSGKAMDFSVAGRTAREVLAYVQAQPEIRYAYAIDGSHVHMDVE